MSPAQRRLEERVAAVRDRLRRRTYRVAGIWVAAGAGAVLALAWVLSGPEGWRQGSDVPFVLDLVVVVFVAAGYLLTRAGARRWFDEAPLSSAIEGAAGLAEGTVRGSLELSRAVPRGVSPSLVTRAAARTVERLNRSVDELSGALGASVRSWAVRGSGAATALAVVLVVLTVASPGRSGRALTGLAAPFRFMADPVLEPIDVDPGSVEVQRGSDVLVAVKAPGRESADITWQSSGEVARTESLVLTGGVGSMSFEAVSSVIEYRVRTPDGAVAGPFRIVPVDPLFVGDVRIEVAYPPHTGIPSEEYRSVVPPLRLPVGTRVIVDGRASRPLSQAALSDEDGREVFRPAIDGPVFEGTWVPRASGTYTWTFADEQGGPAATRPDPLEVLLLPDSAPGVTIPIPGRDTVLPLTLKQPLIIEAHDDYGLRRLELVAYRVTAFGEARAPVTQGLDLGGTRAALARPLLDLTGWGLLPGDQVRYHARAVDNAPVPQETLTPEYVLRVPQASEMRRDAEDQLREMAQRLEELADEAGRKADETRDMERQAVAERQDEGRQPGRPEPSELGFEEREELREALENQQAMTGQVDSMRAELAALQEIMKEAGQADPELRRDLEELQELLRQIASEGLQERLEELSRSLDQQDARDARKSLEELAKEQENFRDRIEESLERFRRAAAEQDFRATKSEVAELARQEEALSDAFEEGDDPARRAEQQAQLEQRAGELDQRMERLEERLEQLGEKDAAREVQEARESAQQASQQMSQAREQAERQRSREAGEKAQEAAASLEEAAEQLEQAQQQMAAQQAEQAQQALRDASDDALSLARRQTELRQDMQGGGQERIDQMRADEASLLQGVRNLAQNLQASSEEAGRSSPELSAQIGQAMESIQRTIQAMESRRGPSPSPSAAAEQAVADLNQLALMAMAGAEQMGQQGQGQGGGEEVSQQLEQLAQQQGEVNNQTGQLTPLQLGEQALREQLERLAQEQQKVADDLGELSEEEGAQERSLGDLERLAQEAQALAQQLAQGRLDPETVRRQEQLFHRLLDAGRSLERDEDVSEERESEVAGVFERADVVPLRADQLGALKYRLPDADQLQGLSPAVRQLVLQYFERLNRGASGAGPGTGR